MEVSLCCSSFLSRFERRLTLPALFLFPQPKQMRAMLEPPAGNSMAASVEKARRRSLLFARSSLSSSLLAPSPVRPRTESFHLLLYSSNQFPSQESLRFHSRRIRGRGRRHPPARLNAFLRLLPSLFFVTHPVPPFMPIRSSLDSVPSFVVIFVPPSLVVAQSNPFDSFTFFFSGSATVLSLSFFFLLHHPSWITHRYNLFFSYFINEILELSPSPPYRVSRREQDGEGYERTPLIIERLYFDTRRLQIQLNLVRDSEGPHRIESLRIIGVGRRFV